jgi:dTDP-4-amino-4,6-dideoxygalactose transaminase
MPKLAEVQEYYQLAEKHGQYSNFGLCYDIAVTKLQKVYPGLHPVLVNNGTTAIQVALQATLPRGSRVALPTFTFTATLNAVIAAGMVPVLFDVDPNTWQIDLSLLDSNMDKYDAFIVVSPFGYQVDVVSYDRFSESIHKPIVYDFAPAWGHPISRQNPTTFSFHATKTLPIGEGGAVMFSNPEGQQYGRRLINFDFENQMPQSLYGMNGKLDELHCATLCAQLDRNDQLLTRCALNRRVVDVIREQMRVLPIKGDSWLQLPVFRFDKAGLSEFLVSNGIASKRYYTPLLHEAFPDIEFVSSASLVAPKDTVAVACANNLNEGNEIVNLVLDYWRAK